MILIGELVGVRYIRSIPYECGSHRIVVGTFYIATHYIDGAHVSTVEYLVDMEIESVVDVCDCRTESAVGIGVAHSGAADAPVGVVALHVVEVADKNRIARMLLKELSDVSCLFGA